MFSVGAHVRVSPACDGDYYIPPTQENFCFSSLTPASLSQFYEVSHYVIQSESQSFTGRRRHVMCSTQTLLPTLRLWSSYPPCEVVLFLVVHSSRIEPVLHCVIQREAWSYTGRMRLCCVHTNTFPPFTALVKLPPL